jgi:hypothetical protein
MSWENYYEISTIKNSVQNRQRKNFYNKTDFNNNNNNNNNNNEAISVTSRQHLNLREMRGLPQYLDNRLTNSGEVLQPHALSALYLSGIILVLISVGG